jgi:hypothetical protein
MAEYRRVKTWKLVTVVPSCPVVKINKKEDKPLLVTWKGGRFPCTNPIKAY